jgi:hypoxanthine phosphoribosyltransferase
LPRWRLTALSQNKNKEKKGRLPEDMLNENRYLAARTVGDVWICYPWEATDIDEHDEMAGKQPSN